MNEMKIKQGSLYVFSLVATCLTTSAYANSGDILQTVNGTVTGMTAISMTLDSENNVYVLYQSGHTVCAGSLTGYGCNWEWITGSGATKIQMFSKLVLRTDPETGTGGTSRTINQWIQEFTQSNIWGFINFLILMILEYILFFGALGYGLVYGFRFFKNKK